MNAITIDKLGESGSLREAPKQTPQSGEVLARVNVAGVNPIDWKIRDGAMGDVPMPLTLGQDFAGTIEAAGADVSGFAAGDRVFGISRTHGAYAEFTVVSTTAKGEPIGKLPSGVTDEQAAALPTPGLTALASLDELHVGKGTTIVIHGAAGAVGAFATQLAQHRGAHVVATVKGATADAKALGAHDVIDTSKTDVIGAIKKEHPDGVDAVLDLVSTDRNTNLKFADVLRKGGALVSTTHVADEDAFKQRGLKATNINLAETPQSSRESLEQLAGLVADGKLVVRIGRELPLKDAPNVLDQSKSGKMLGKTVLRVSQN